MNISSSFNFLKPIYHAYRFCILSFRIIKGVYHSKRLPKFKIRYKVGYTILGSNRPSTILNTRIPPKVGDKVDLADYTVEVIDVVQPIPPRGEFCFLQATCRKID